MGAAALSLRSWSEEMDARDSETSSQAGEAVVVQVPAATARGGDGPASFDALEEVHNGIWARSRAALELKDWELADGERVADALQTGVKEGILYGLLKKEELPGEPKVSPMTIRLKANGNARIIMDLSAPHGPKLEQGEACSPNEGMKEYNEFEPVTMAGDVA